MPAVITMFRPVGQAELELVRASGMRAFPPRLAHQPIFYPVENEDYATRIARDWNTKDANSGFAGYVLRFAVDAVFMQRYPLQKVGGARDLEWWVPAEEVADFNAHLVGAIEIVSEFRR